MLNILRTTTVLLLLFPLIINAQSNLNRISIPYDGVVNFRLFDRNVSSGDELGAIKIHLEKGKKYALNTSTSFFQQGFRVEFSSSLNSNAILKEKDVPNSSLSDTIFSAENTTIYLKFYAKEDLIVPMKRIGFELSIQPMEEKTICSYHANSKNSIQKPVQFDLEVSGDQTGQTKSISDCNTSCGTAKLLAVGRKLERSSPIKWYEMTIPSSGEFIHLELISTFSNPSVIFVSKNADGFQVVNQINGTDGIAEQEFFFVYPYKKLYLGVYDQLGATGQYNLNITGYPKITKCADYFDDYIPELNVSGTSKGSPLEGPYKAGEVITFEYIVPAWIPIHNNLPHSFVPEFGESWDVSSFLIDTLWPTNVSLETKLGKPERWMVLFNDQLELKDSIQEMLSGGSFEGIGLYYMNTEFGCVSTRPFYSKGANPNTFITEENEDPLLTLSMSLKIPDTLECDMEYDLSLAMRIHSDYSTGNEGMEGCSSCLTELELELACCETPFELSNAKPQLCSGEISQIEVIGASVFPEQLSWYEEDIYTPNNSRYFNKGYENQTSQSIFKTIGVVIDHPDACPDTLETVIEIFPEFGMHPPLNLNQCTPGIIEFDPSIYSYDADVLFRINGEAHPIQSYYVLHDYHFNYINLRLENQKGCVEEETIVITPFDDSLNLTVDSLIICDNLSNPSIAIDTDNSSITTAHWIIPSGDTIQNANSILVSESGVYRAYNDFSSPCVLSDEAIVLERENQYLDITICQSDLDSLLDDFTDWDIEIIPVQSYDSEENIGSRSSDTICGQNHLNIYVMDCAQLPCDIIVSPNPTNGQTMISLQNPIDLSTLVPLQVTAVHPISGLVFDLSIPTLPYHLDLTNYPVGLYYLIVKDKNNNILNNITINKI